MSDLDLDALERLSAELHDIYQIEAERQHAAEPNNPYRRLRHPDSYDELAENVKEFDRVLARFILQRENALIQRLRDFDSERMGWLQLELGYKQRLREAEAALQQRIEWQDKYSSNERLELLWAAEARITKLERVRKAAKNLQEARKRYFAGSLKDRVPNSNLINEAEAELVAALAAVEEKP